jgi:hypothetical protein
VEHTDKIDDGGIDGIIRQDPLGLDRIDMQAKRYGAENSVEHTRLLRERIALIARSRARTPHGPQQRRRPGPVDVRAQTPGRGLLQVAVSDSTRRRVPHMDNQKWTA